MVGTETSYFMPFLVHMLPWKKVTRTLTLLNEPRAQIFRLLLYEDDLNTVDLLLRFCPPFPRTYLSSLRRFVAFTHLVEWYSAAS